jgi:hypothetical protein
VDLTVYSTLVVNLQIILSSWSESDVFRIICHNCTNSLMSSEFCIRCIPVIHVLLLHPWATVKIFRETNRKILGAISLGLCPDNHRTYQKLVCSPFPTVMLVHARNKASSNSILVMFRFARGLFMSLHWYHFHLSLKAVLKRDRSRIPSPPSFLGC